jgi:hydroxypyruvate isomerase
MTPTPTRRSALKALTGTAAIAAVVADLGPRVAAAESQMGAMKGRLRHSVCKWCYPDIPLAEFAVACKEIGLTSIELLQPTAMETLGAQGLTIAMVSGRNVEGLGGIPRAWNRVEHHDRLLEGAEQQIKTMAGLGLANMICFSGNREGLDDEQGLENCAIGLKRLMPIAERHDVVVCMELLNSKVNHPDYMCDHTAWGVELCKRVGSENFKLLYDIYHMQIMEGDLIRTIRESHQYFAHYHTGGNPGRHEIDETQEINYPAVMRAIVETGYTGFVAQEFVPAREDKLASLKQGVEICDV